MALLMELYWVANLELHLDSTLDVPKELHLVPLKEPLMERHLGQDSESTLDLPLDLPLVLHLGQLMVQQWEIPMVVLIELRLEPNWGLALDLPLVLPKALHLEQPIQL